VEVAGVVRVKTAAAPDATVVAARWERHVALSFRAARKQRHAVLDLEIVLFRAGSAVSRSLDL
jgi:hypothetical protein